MYKTFFNLRSNPFDLSPDPAYFVPTRRHNEALAALYYGIRQHKGFVVLTGEVGTGKTLLLRCLLGLLKESRDIAYAYVFNGRLSPTEFLQYILADFGLAKTGRNKSDLLFHLGQFVLARGSQKMTTVLIVDEAHHLSADILEEVRLLSNLETDNDKLLQILLVGQPELDYKLDSSDLRQLKQRIAVRAHLGSLDTVETECYIQQRLQNAGVDMCSESLFSSQAITAIYHYSDGLPRLINTICDNALVTAYARRLPHVTHDVVHEVATEFRLDRTSSVKRHERDNDLDVPKLADLLLSLYAALRPPAPSAEHLRPIESREEPSHEPYI
jgi:general secretion pathway protein A